MAFICSKRNASVWCLCLFAVYLIYTVTAADAMYHEAE